MNKVLFSVILILGCVGLNAQSISDQIKKLERQRDSLENIQFHTKLARYESKIAEWITPEAMADRYWIDSALYWTELLAFELKKANFDNFDEAERPSNRLSGALNRATANRNATGSGSGGVGNSGDYQLGSRAATERPKPRYDCNGNGKVVVKVYVNRYGKTVRVEGGQAGSTAPQCLIDRAEAAAMKTKWEGDPAAPELQVGQITYRFKRN